MNIVMMSFHKDDGSKLWPELKDKKAVHAVVTTPIRMAVLEKGTESGKPSVMMALTMPDGSLTIAQVAAVQLATFARALEIKYPGLLD